MSDDHRRHSHWPRCKIWSQIIVRAYQPNHSAKANNVTVTQTRDKHAAVDSHGCSKCVPARAEDVVRWRVTRVRSLNVTESLQKRNKSTMVSKVRTQYESGLSRAKRATSLSSSRVIVPIEAESSSTTGNIGSIDIAKETTTSIVHSEGTEPATHAL